MKDYTEGMLISLLLFLLCHVSPVQSDMDFASKCFQTVVYFYIYHNHNNIIIIIAFKGAIQDFLQSPRSAASCLQHVRSSDPGAIVCKSRATHQAFITCKCHVTCHLV